MTSALEAVVCINLQICDRPIYDTYTPVINGQDYAGNFVASWYSFSCIYFSLIELQPCSAKHPPHATNLRRNNKPLGSQEPENNMKRKNSKIKTKKGKKERKRLKPDGI